MSDSTRISLATIRPSFVTPVRIRMIMECREVEAANCSARVYSSLTGRPVAMVRCAQMSSIITSCLLPKPPPIRGLITRIRLTGSPSTGARMRRAWNGTCVLAWITSRSSESQCVMQTYGSMGVCCTRGTSYSPSKTRSACFSAASTSPSSMSMRAAMLRARHRTRRTARGPVRRGSRVRPVPCCHAGSRIAGSSSYSTSISASARSAISSVSAATAATRSPM